MDAESLLDSVGMAHWLRQEDKVPEYEDMLTKAELLEWVRLQVCFKVKTASEDGRR